MTSAKSVFFPVLSLFCAAAFLPSFADTTYTPSDAGWGEALAVADGETVIIDGSGTWVGAITVSSNATLKVRGDLIASGTVGVAKGGVLDLESGTSYFAFGSRDAGLAGDLYIRAGAQWNMNSSALMNYGGGYAIHVYGTLNGQAYRISLGAADKIYLHDGARLIGTGDFNNAGATNGLLDFYENGCRLVVDGNVTCEGPVRARNANQTTYIVCFEGARLNLAGGIIGAANVTQVAATAADGNASGTCADAVIEVGPSTCTGKFTFISKAAVALTGAAPSFTVESSASEIEFRADADVARANHVFAQGLPAVATSATLPTVRLAGEGVVSLGTTAPSYPVVLAGATLAIENGAPVALAAGSSVVSNTVIGVEGLAAETAATLLTGADSSFDVTKVSAQAMHNGVLVGAPAAVLLDNGNVVVSGVTAYDETAWLMPYLRTKALIWLDASDAANFIFKDSTFGYVTGWKDLSSYGRNATSYMANYGSLGVTNGVPAYLMGEVAAQIDMNFTRMTTIRTVFEAMAIRSKSQGFNQWLGDDTACHFHRNTDGSYDSQWGMQNCSFYKDGELVAAPRTTVPPSDRHVYTIVTPSAANANQLSRDRKTNARSSGRDLSELIVLDEVLSDTDRQQIESYLAAKWMGASPAAAAADNTYTFRGGLEVDGAIGGTQNLAFEDGASITVANPATEGAMVTTTGSVVIPSGATVAVDVDARALPLGTYTVIDAAGGVTSLSQFSATAEVAPGAEAAFSVADGKLVMTIARAAAATTSLTWRPQDASDLAWGSANWLYSDGVTTGGFIGYLNTVFDGAESVSGNIAVDDTYSVGPVSIMGAKDYTFTGTGTLAGTDPVVIDTTGTVTLNGPNLGDQDVIVSNGTLRLGVNAGDYALGTRTGRLKIAGGTLDLNAPAGTTARGTISHRKEIELSRGGRIENNNVANCYAVGNLTVVDSGTLGGTARFDVRVNAADTECTTTTIDGGDDAVLNVDTTGDAIGFYNVSANIGRINVLGGKLRIEQPNGEYNVPNGIHVADGAVLGYYGGTSTTGATVNVDSGTAQIQAENGTSYMKGPLAVASGSTAQLCGGQFLNYEGGIQNAGTVRTTSGNHIFKGDIAGSSYEVAGGQMRLAGAVQESSLTIPVSSSSLYVKDGMTAGTITANVTGGDAGFLLESAVAPVFEAYNLNLGANTSYILPRVAGQIIDLSGTVNFSQTDAGKTYVYSTTNNNEFGVAMKATGAVGTLSVGLDGGRAGTIRLKDGSDLSAKYLWTGDNKAIASRGRVVIDSGAKVTIRSGGDVRNGHWSQAPATPQTHVIDIAGELDSSAGPVYNPMDAPRAEMYLREGGVLKAKGFSAARRGSGADAFDARYVFPYGNGVGAAEGRNYFIMEGGRLELGASGIVGTRTPGVTKFDFRNGDIVNTAAWGGGLVTSSSFSSDERGGDYCFPMFFGYDALGGSVTFDLGAYNVNWQTGLSGASDLTIKGSANFQGSRNIDRMQGAMVGKLTVENTGANDLRATSAFAGGLALAPGVNAQVAKYGETNYAYAATTGSTKWNYMDHMADTAWSYNFISSDFFGFAYKKFTASPIGTATVSLGRGEFYVPADKAGVWTFAGNYDDRICLKVDGTQVFKTSAWSEVGRGTNTLAAGWHKFTLAVWDGGQPGGPSDTSGWGDGKALGFHVGETTDTTAESYVTFADGEDFGDGTKLQVRPYANVAVWSFCNAYSADTLATREDWTHIKCIDALDVMYKNSAASDASAWQPYIKAKTNKFEGWFKVEEGKVGEWTFSVCYDDRALLKIDGAEIARNSAWNAPASNTVHLASGWHRWEVRTGEGGGGGWGPDADQNGGDTVRYRTPGETEYSRFDENNLKLAATLGDIAVLEPNGIHKELELGEGSTLTSSGTMAMPIYGTLKGTGALAGAWEFAGDGNCWEVTNAVVTSAALPAATFADATTETFAGLKSVRVLFNAKPSRRTYYLTDAVAGLAAAPAASVVVKDASGADYSANFMLTVKDGRLTLANSKPAGTLILVR